MFYGDRVEDVDDGLPKYLGKQGDRPVDARGKRLPEEQNAKKNKDREEDEEKENKEEKEEKTSKKQKKE
jgi:hypothetical protein